MAAKLKAAIELGREEEVKQLLLDDPCLSSMVVDGCFYYPLHLAAELGRTNICKILLKHDEKLINDCYGSDGGTAENPIRYATPLTYAAKEGKLATCEFLLEKGADIDKCGIKTDTPLTAAAKSGNIDICELLLEKKAKVNFSAIQSISISTFSAFPLQHAAKIQHIPLCKLLLDNGAKVDVCEGDFEYLSPLGYAAQNGNLDLCKLLVEEYKADINCTAVKKELGWFFLPGFNQTKIAPLWLAAESGSLQVCKYLYNKGMLQIEKKKSAKRPNTQLGLFTGKSNLDCFIGPLVWAASQGNDDVCEWFLSIGVDPNGLCPKHNFKWSGFSPLHAAACKGHFSTCAILLNNGADVKLKDNYISGKSPLHYACGSCYDTTIDAESRSLKGYNEFSIKPPIEADDRLKIAQLLIDKGASIDERDQGDQTPLHCAALNAYVNICKLLLEQKRGCEQKRDYLNIKNLDNLTAFDFATGPILGPINIDSLSWYYEELKHEPIPASNERRNTCYFFLYEGANPRLHYAALNGYYQICKSFIEYKADDQAFVDEKIGRDEIIPLYCAIRSGVNETCKLLLNYVKDVNAQEKSTLGYSALHLAASIGSTDLCKTLLEHKETKASQLSSGCEKTPLHCAITGNKIAVCKLLLDHGVDPNMQSGSGETALHYAVRTSEKGEIDMCKLLLQYNVDANICEYENDLTVLHYCSQLKKCSEICRMLLYDFGENIKVNCRTRINKTTPLHWAAERGNVKVFEMLLDQKNIYINAKDSSGGTPLHCAAVLRGNVKVCEMLLDQRNILINEKNNSGMTPLHYAARCKNKSICQLLLNHSTKALYWPDNDGGTPLQTVLRYYQSVLKSGKRTRDCGDCEVTNEIVLLFLQNGADINAANPDGVTPLMFAAMNYDENITKMMLEKGADVNATDCKGRTPLSIAVSYSDWPKDVAEVLIEYGANVQIKTPGELNDEAEDEWNLLHLATFNHQLELCKLLFEKMVDIRAITPNGHSALQLALENILPSGRRKREKKEFLENRNNLCKWLLENGADVNVWSELTCFDIFNSPIFVALAVHRDIRLSEMLIDYGADIYAVSPSGSLLHQVILYLDKFHENEYCDCIPEITLLIEKGADVNLSQGITLDDGDLGVVSPLHIAAFKGYRKLVQLLLAAGAIPFDVEMFENRIKSSAILNLIRDRYAQAILNLIRDRYAQFMQYMKCDTQTWWNHSKLVFLGEDKSGKTSTLHSLLGKSKTTRAKEPKIVSTAGTYLGKPPIRNAGSWSVDQENFITYGLDRENIKRLSDHERDDNSYQDNSYCGDSLCLTIWDTKGGYCTKVLNHILFTKLGVYILVVDLRRLCSSAETKTKEECLSYTSGIISAIRLHASNVSFMIVGTFKNEISSKEIPSINDTLSTLIKNNGMQKSCSAIAFIENEEEDLHFFPIDNECNEDFSQLQRIIKRESLKQKLQVPKNWLLLLDKILRNPNSRISLKEVRAIAKSESVGIKTSNEVDKALSLFHEIGALFHFQWSEITKGSIVSPQWFLAATYKILCHDRYYHLMNQATAAKELKYNLKLDDHHTASKTAQNNGLLSPELVELRLLREENEESRNYLVQSMIRMMILSNLAYKGKESYFCVPSWVQNSTDKENQDTMQAKFDFSETTSLIPCLEIFQRLTCLCIGHSIIGEPHIARNLVSLEPEQGLKITLSLNEADKCISLHVPKEVENKMANKAVSSVSLTMEKIKTFYFLICNYAVDIKWKTSVQCFWRNGSKFFAYEDAQKKQLPPWFDQIYDDDIGTIRLEALMDTV